MARRKAASQAMPQTPAEVSASDAIASTPVSTAAPSLDAIVKSLDAIAKANGLAEPHEPATVATSDLPAMAQVLPEASPQVTPPMLTTIEAPKTELPTIEPAKIGSAKIATLTLDPPKLATIDIPEFTPISVAAVPSLDDVRPGEPEAPAATTNVTDFPAWARVRRLLPFAASIVIAAAAGAMAGSLATTGLNAIWASAPTTQTADAKPLQDAIARINAELAALKSAIDSSGKTSSAQLIKLSDRFDKYERAQAEPAAKLAKLTEAVDRIERRTPGSQVAARDVTGSIAAPTIAAPTTQPAAEAAKPGPPVLEAWRVRSVYNGAALIQGRMGSVVEVEPGDTLPGLGRIETIRRQDGRWVVVTSKGLILAR
jgi:hypothetical protein